MASDNIRQDPRYPKIVEQIELVMGRGLDSYLDMISLSLGVGKEIDIRKAVSDKLIIMSRYYDVIRAASYDIYRYAYFHEIKDIENDCKEFNISEACIASYVMKWIVSLHPLSFDVLLEVGDTIRSVNTPQDLCSDEDIKKFESERMLNLCNEYYAIIVASIIICKYKDNKIMTILEGMDTEEKDTILYGLRYRIKHQDVYTSLLKRIQACL